MLSEEGGETIYLYDLQLERISYDKFKRKVPRFLSIKMRLLLASTSVVSFLTLKICKCHIFSGLMVTT